ncbi:hypothetical protein GCM10010387_26730 [Streptomyces inusitatus]|uniref:Zinc ribbon domain-containing protein n=1 Tax=Streptomyces inusitatus TaxID=68221 RepID=A0A918Q2E1_9ACTN|nr:hypothetical protein GCM10010387_26730 [Streptomyces inusitatus]
MICEACGQRNAPGTAFCTSCEAFLDWEPSQAPGTGTGTRTRTEPEPEPSAGADDSVVPRRPGDEEGPLPPEADAADAPAPAPAPPGRSVRCPGCRAENPPGRTLCVRCALLLDPGPGPGPVVRLAWWRRVLRQGPRAAPPAGARPRRRLWRRPGLALPLALVVVVAAVWFGLPHLPWAIGFAKEETGAQEPLPPAVFRASSSAPGHPASAAFDGFNNRYWAPGRAGREVGEFVECDFEQPVKVRRIIVFSGVSARRDEFLTQARPAGITVTFVAESGERTTKRIRLKDQPGQQTFEVRGDRVVGVRLTTDAAYGTGTGADRRPAIAEVEFFGSRHH